MIQFTAMYCRVFSRDENSSGSSVLRSALDLEFFTEETLWRGGKVQWETFYEGNYVVARLMLLVLFHLP